MLFGGFALATEITQLEKAATQGDDTAQYSLGVLYATGDGVRQDASTAAKWFQKAAEQGHASAQASLGSLYASGDGVARNTAVAEKWFGKAAEQGNEWAQMTLGAMYLVGDGVPKDAATAAKWFRKAAEQGNSSAQLSLAGSYAVGKGVPKDEIEGLAWCNVAAATDDSRVADKAVKLRGMIEARLGRQATLVAQQRSKEILKEMEAAKLARASTGQKDSAAAMSPAGEAPKATGSGAIVSTEGHVLTAAHVVAGAGRVNVLTAQGTKSAKVLRVDEANDLAVLKLTDGAFPALPVAPSRKVRLGQAVATIGFPNVEIQGFSPKITRGEISSVSGIGDDPRAWQISVPVQPGNSGGALLDENGNVIGVVVSRLGLKAAKATGAIPQNVNYAVKSTYALALLEPYLGNNAPSPNEGAPKLSFEDMVAKVQQSVVLILVY